MPRLALSLRSAQRRVTPTRALGAAVKHGVFMALPTVGDRIYSRYRHSPEPSGKVYRRTRLVRYLDTARRMADYFLNNIPADGIIPWDFNAPLIPARPADTSAAMIAVNGLLLLAKQEQSIEPTSQSGVSHYFHAAIEVRLPHILLYHIRPERHL
jgi:hypothetical protein